jgi:hypothetical protein
MGSSSQRGLVVSGNFLWSIRHLGGDQSGDCLFKKSEEVLSVLYRMIYAPFVEAE